jgi:mono/diheme cytochrome c family protein
MNTLAPCAGALLLGALCACSDNAPPPAAVEMGQKQFMQLCVPCHREDGSGVPNVYPSLVNSPVVNGDAVDLAQWVLSGKRPATMAAGRYSTQMLLFGWMKDADAAALLTYVRSHFGNDAPPIDAATVAKAR